MNTEDEQPIISEVQANRIIKAIDENFRWVSSKGCSVTNTRMFIENIIRKIAGVEKWAEEGKIDVD